MNKAQALKYISTKFLPKLIVSFIFLFFYFFFDHYHAILKLVNSAYQIQFLINVMSFVVRNGCKPSIFSKLINLRS